MADTTRRGGKWEAAGTLMILGGIFGPMAIDADAAILLVVLVPIGFVVFLIGRFL